MRNLVGAFGWLFGLGVVALVARYGYISSDNEVNGAILAFLFAGLAAGGLFGHAVAVHIWRIHRGWSITLGLICVAALVLNISNSLGAIAGRDDKTIAERSKVKETRADDRAELKRLTAEHEGLPKFVATSADGVKAARDAVTAAERAQRAECEKRGRLCREREGEEAAKREALERVLAARGLTERAEGLEADMKRIRDRLDKSDVVRSINPQGALLAKLFRLPDTEADAAATWQQFALSIVVDLLIMACFIAHEVMGWETRQSKKLAAEDVKLPVMPELPAPVMLALAAKPRLVASAPRPGGGVREFFASSFEVAIGSKVGMTSAYLAYATRCKARDRAAVTTEQFFEAMHQICRQNGFSVELVDGKPHLMNVQLMASSAVGNQMA